MVASDATLSERGDGDRTERPIYATTSSTANQTTDAPLYFDIDTTYMRIGRQSFAMRFVVIAK